MNDLIYKSDAVKALGKRPELKSRYEIGMRDQYDLNRISIELIPPVLPKTGKWIELKKGLFSKIYKCDRCRNILDFSGVNAGRGDANYCPNCGARMEMPED